ncbi:helix-turn-helix domain-containing protein [Pantoea cypripedii]|nr:helix-turn-helix domain-containing protein [Pantoea cypripedii]
MNPATLNTNPDTDLQFRNVVVDMVDWIEKNLGEDLQLRRVTKKSGYSHWHFQRRFTEVSGWKLGEYIRARRLVNAAYDLAFTEKSLAAISVEYGFKSQNSFSRTFIRLLQVKPSVVRKELTGHRDALRELMFHLLPCGDWYRKDDLQLLCDRRGKQPSLVG